MLLSLTVRFAGLLLLCFRFAYPWSTLFSVPHSPAAPCCSYSPQHARSLYRSYLELLPPHYYCKYRQLLAMIETNPLKIQPSNPTAKANPPTLFYTLLNSHTSRTLRDNTGHPSRASVTGLRLPRPTALGQHFDTSNRSHRYTLTPPNFRDSNRLVS